MVYIIRGVLCWFPALVGWLGTPKPGEKRLLKGELVKWIKMEYIKN